MRSHLLISTLLAASLACTGCAGSGGSTPASNTAEVQAAPIPVPVSPAGVVFFRDNAAAGGNGSLSTPFNNLASAVAAVQPGQTLFVLAGSGAPIIWNASMPANISLLGQGVGLGADVPVGAFPRLQGQVTLGTNTTVRGLQFENPSGDALIGSSGLVCDSNRFSNLSGDGLQLLNQTGLVRVTNNQFNDDANTNPRQAVLVQLNQTQTLDLTFDNNSFTTPDRTASFDSGLTVQAQDTAQLTLTTRLNRIETQGSGLSLNLLGGSKVTANLSQNTFVQNPLDAISALIGGSSTDTVASNMTISQNTFTQPQGTAALLRARGSGQQDWTVSQNTVDSAGNFGLTLVRNDTAKIRGLISDNQFNNALQAAIQVTTGDATGGFSVPLRGEERLTIRDNRITGTGLASMAFSMISQTQAVLLTGNICSGRIDVLSRSAAGCFGAGANTAIGAIAVTVENGFALTYDDRGQTNPAVTFPGGGTVTPGPCVP